MTRNDIGKLLEDFKPDGAWRDVVVHPWSLSSWDAYLAWVRSGPRPFQFYRDGELVPLPTTAADVFAMTEEASALLSLYVGSGIAQCHFFDTDSFELDIDPSDYQTRDTIRPLLDFVADLGRALRCTVLITLENAHDEVLARFDPVSSDFVYVPRR